MRVWRYSRTTAFLVLACLVGGNALAQTYPSRPIKVIVPYAAGASSDALCRVLINELQVVLKAQMAIDNRPGAGGNIGTAEATRAKPDGYTLLCTGMASTVTNPLLYSSLGFDPNDLDPISGLGSSGFFLLANNTMKGKSLKEIIAWAKAAPQPLKVGTASSLAAILYGLLRKEAGVEFARIPYTAATGLVPDLMRNDLDLVVEPFPATIGAVNGNLVTVIGVSTSQRTPILPNAPTFVEQGVNIVFDGWTALFAPKGLPEDMIATLNRATHTVLKSPDVQKRLELLSAQAMPTSPKELADLITNTRKAWAPIVDDLKLKAD